METQKERVTTKIWQQSLFQLKVIAALTKTSMIDTLARLIEAEYQRVKGKEEERMLVKQGLRVEMDLNNEQVTACLKHGGASRFAYNYGVRRKQEA